MDDPLQRIRSQPPGDRQAERQASDEDKEYFSPKTKLKFCNLVSMS